MEQTREQRKSSARSALVVGKLGLTPLGGANTEYMTEDTAPKCKTFLIAWITFALVL